MSAFFFKFSFYYSCITLLLVLQLSSCSVDPTPTVTTNFFRATANVSTVTSFIFNSTYSSKASLGPTIITISGIQVLNTVSGYSVYGLDVSNRSIVINFSDLTSLGGYNLSNINMNFNPVVYLTDGANIYFPNKGQLVFSKIDFVARRVEGNFTFLGINTKSNISVASVTGGSFGSFF